MAKKSKFREIPPYRITSGAGGYKADDAAVTIGGKILPDNIDCPVIENRKSKSDKPKSDKPKKTLYPAQVYWHEDLKEAMEKVAKKKCLDVSPLFKMFASEGLRKEGIEI